MSPEAHAPGYESLHFSSSLFSLAFTWEWTCACPCTRTSTHPSLPHKNFTVIMMEIARAWSEGSCWIKEPRHSDKEHAVPSALPTSPHHYLTVVHIYDDVISNCCCICSKNTFQKNKVLADKPGPIPGLHLHLSGLGNAPEQNVTKDELMSYSEAAFVSTVKFHLLEHRP